MSLNADQATVAQVGRNDNSIPFEDKKWTYLTDSSSNGGTFTNQIQWNLNTLSSNDWVDLSEATINLPIKVRIYNSGSVSQTPASVTRLAAVLKNGYHHVVDQLQVIIDGSTIQMNQIFENINTTFKILTENDQDWLAKTGPSLGFSSTNLDDVPVSNDTAGLYNLAANTLMPANKGVDLTGSINTSIPERQYYQNIDGVSTSKLVSSILGFSNARQVGLSAVANSAGSCAVGADCYVQFVLATIRLKDISDVISKMGPVKNLKGFIYLNYNSAAVTVTSDASGVLNSTPSYNTLQGRCMPAMLNLSGFSPSASAVNSWTIEYNVNGVPSTTSSVSSVSPTINYGRLNVPVYTANPTVDNYLSTTRMVRYNERYSTSFSVNANSDFNVTITPGLANAKRLIMIPYFTSYTTAMGAAANVTINPYQSPYHPAPATTDILPAIKNFQCYVQNKAIYNSPVNFDYELFLNELNLLGIDGNMNDMLQSGLINQRQWSQLYRYMTVDLSRRMSGDDGATCSIQVSGTNATTGNLNVLCFVWFEKQFNLDPATCTITQN